MLQQQNVIFRLKYY